MDYTYDAHGRVLTAYGHNMATNVPTKMTDYTYDDAGRLIKAEGYYIIEDDAFCSVYSYDESGNLISIKSMDGDQVVFETKYSADGLILEKRDHAQGNVEKYTYTDDGKPLNECYKNDGLTVKETNYYYNSQGKIEKKHTDFLGYWYGRKSSTTIYDDYGKISKVIEVNKLDKETCIKYTYDDAGNLLSVWGGYGTLGGSWWNYDEQGRVTRFGYINEEGKKFVYCSWSYDATGNVVQMEYDSQQHSVYQFTYAWPDEDLPQVVKDSVAQYVAELAGLDQYCAENYLND